MARLRAADPQRRGKGRPRRDGPGVGREAVIAATRELLKRVPPSKITRAALSREAGIDPALVRYYFGNTSALLTEVILEIADELAANRVWNKSAEAPFRERLRQRVQVLTQTLEENPHLHEMLIQRAVFGQQAMGKDIKRIRERYNAEGLASLSALIEDGVRSGECRPVNLHYLYMALIGLSEFFINAYPLFVRISGGGGNRSEAIDGYVDFVTDLIMAGLTPRDIKTSPK